MSVLADQENRDAIYKQLVRHCKRENITLEARIDKLQTTLNELTLEKKRNETLIQATEQLLEN